MGVPRERVVSVSCHLLGFAKEKVLPLESIELPVTAGTYPRQKVIMVKFLIVDRTSAYNAIIGRIALNDLKAVTSTPHLSMKFPTEEGVGVVKGDQKEARRCYNLSLKSTPRQYNLGIDPSVIVHKMNVDSSHQPVKQRRRTFAAERNQAITEEVEKLKAGFIRKVHYPEWLANVVLVKKSNAIKGQVLADFLVEFCNIPEAEELPKESTWVVHVDGSSARSRSGVGAILRNPEGQEFGFAIKLDFVTTNNEAEYEAVIAGLLSQRYPERKIPEQMNSQRSLQEQMKRLRRTDEEIEASQRQIIVLIEPSITPKDNIMEVGITPNEPEWATEIIQFLKNGSLPQEKAEARKVKNQATRFC
ncbi:uncharacterized protein LOC133876752 [Alnus glutinosa]|uniref:uncharacterized protein LOC133876752 n=1 Tax=Alnus glutinosa TaxID=3517 RepID=UPI002D776DA6|nr:uncharacterized protein LOC133876752 [Alnus glutinosa]